jgi:hypothetical protein
MILDRLDKCPFCLQKLVIQNTGVGWALMCPNEDKHHHKTLWCWLEEEEPRNITCVNIKVDNCQFHWSFANNSTSLMGIADFSHLLDFELTEENIVNKIKTIKTFM